MEFISKKTIKYVGKEKGRKKILYQSPYPKITCKPNVINLGKISGWWEYLKPFLEDKLKQFKECDILDKRQENGKELIEVLQQSITTELSLEDPDLVVVCINNKNEIEEIHFLNAEPESQDQYDSMAAEMNGILRVIDKTL